LSILASLAIYKLAKTRLSAIPIDDVAVFTVLCICLYTFLPVISWLLQGGQYIVPIGRLYEMQPTISEVYELTLLGAVPIFGVLVVYSFRRNTLAKLNLKPLPTYNWWISKKLLFICVAIFISTYVFQSVIEFRFGISDAESYTDTYFQYASLPLGVGQLLQLSRTALSLSMLVVITAIIMRWNIGGKRWFIIIAAFVFLSFEVGYSRTQLFYFILLSILLYHMFVQPITSFKKAFLFFLLFFIIFLFLGIRGEELVSLAALPLGEFDIIWGNGVHLLRERDADSLSIPLAAYLNEFLNFIPSQLLPYEKIDMPNWYLDTYYPAYKAKGGGLMFGSISQSIVGFGVIESFCRGVVVGLLSIKLKENLHKHHSCWSLILFLLIYMRSYNFVRLGNFSSIVGLLGLTLLVVVAIRFLNRVLPSKKHPNISVV
jgi:hypothetical protein